MLRPNTQIVVLNFPHNPTGFIPDAETWHTLVNICKERNVMLFSDEIYRLSNNDGSEPYPSACLLYENAVTLFGLSKSFGLPGLRIGWLCTKNKSLMREMQNFKDYTTSCSSAPSEILAVISLRNASCLVSRAMNIIKSNLACLDDFFAKYSRHFTWHRPKAGTTTLMGLNPALLEIFGGSATQFCDQVREGCGVLFVPASMYDFPDKYVRLGFGKANLKEVLGVLEGFFNKHKIQPQMWYPLQTSGRCRSDYNARQTLLHQYLI